MAAKSVAYVTDRYTEDVVFIQNKVLRENFVLMKRKCYEGNALKRNTQNGIRFMLWFS